MNVYPIGQRFKSRSKIQAEFVEYIYKGPTHNDHLIEAVSGISEDDCVVDVLWFDNREIKMI